MVSIKLEGDTKKLLYRLRSLAETDKKSLNKVISQLLRSSTVQRFKTQQAPDSQRWKQSIRAEREGGKTLVQTGRLRNSIHTKSDETGLAVGTNTIYASTHQLGAQGRSITIKAKTSKGLVFMINGKWIRKKQVTVHVNIPARPFLGISKEDMQDIKDIIDDHFAED